MTRPVIVVDIETYSEQDIGKVGAFRYAQDPGFEVLLIAYALGEAAPACIDLTLETDPRRRDLLPWLFDPAYIKRAHNAAFEWWCLSEWYGLSWAERCAWLDQWECSMIHALYCGLPAQLAALGKALQQPEDTAKMRQGKALVGYFCKPCAPTQKNGQRTRNRRGDDPGKWALFMQYNAQDVVAERANDRRLAAWPVPEGLWQQWRDDLRMNAAGVAVDLDLTAGALACAGQVNQSLADEAAALTGLANPGSRAQLLDWLEGRGCPLPDLRAETVAAALKGSSLPGDVARVLEIRQQLSKTSLTKYGVVAACAGPDGRIRGTLQFYGAARTGRWAGRLLQVQNLPRTYIGPTEQQEYRQIVKLRDGQALQMLCGDVSGLLSQLIRTVLVPGPGCVFLDADFSAIEARLIAWLAGEEWVLEVFRTTGKIYEATAAKLFGVPVETIRKGHPNYSYRQRGKVATLALGYQGGVGAMKRMGGEKLGLDDAGLQDIVDRWRETNPAICRLWRQMEKAAKKTVRTGQATRPRPDVVFRLEASAACPFPFLTMELPSGRKLFYADPRLNEKDQLTYKEYDTGQWRTAETYGGKLTENCLGGQTQVLTPFGWKRLDQIEPGDNVWDGAQWVPHGGLLYKGCQHVVEVDGVSMTPEHRIYTESGWIDASSCKKFDRYEVGLPHGYRLRRYRRKTLAVEDSLRLWKRVHHARRRVYAGKAKVLRLYEKRANQQGQVDAWTLESSAVPCVAIYEGEVHPPDRAGLDQLRRTGHQGLRPLVAQLRGVLGRYVPELPAWTYLGQDRPERGLFPRKLPLGDPQRTEPEQAQQPYYSDAVGPHNSGRGRRNVRHRHDNVVIQTGPRCNGRYVVRDTGCKEQVYDLKDCGPRHCFTVMSAAGPMLVHNCTQAVGRDCLAFALDSLREAGYKVVFHVHDEVVIEYPADRDPDDALADVARIMSQPAPWAEGLPLNAAGWVGDFFTKD